MAQVMPVQVFKIQFLLDVIPYHMHGVSRHGENSLFRGDWFELLTHLFQNFKGLRQNRCNSVAGFPVGDAQGAFFPVNVGPFARW